MLIQKSDTFSAMLASVKNAAGGVVKSFSPDMDNVPAVAGFAPAEAKNSFRAVATSTTGGLPNWAFMFASLAAVVAAAWFFIFKKKARPRRRR